MTSIGLSMIVKDAEQATLRTLASVRPLIDYALIMDVGSADGNQAAIRDFLAKERLPGEVIEEPWRDFAYNRNIALARLRERTDIDYAFVMDAGDTLAFADGFDAAKVKRALDQDFYHVEIRQGPFRLWRAQILRNSLAFGYKGVLHEIVVGPDGASSAGPVAGLFIQAKTEDADNPEKYRAEATVLERALETESDQFMRARYSFYLAESWMRAGDHEKALQTFLRRAELGGWSQEVCLSLYHAGQLKEVLGHDDTDIVGTFLKGYEADSKRAEPLHGAMEYCRRTNKHHQGYLIGKHAITMPEPVGAPFIAAWIYDYGLLEEFSVHAFKSGHYGACVEAIEKLLAEGKIPEGAHERLKENARIARENLKAESAEQAKLSKSKRARQAPRQAPQRER
jgi:hypothetical protein